LFAPAAVIAAIAALARGSAATTTAATIVALALLIVITARVTGRTTGLRRRRLLGLASENTFQPADKTAGFFLRLRLRTPFRQGLIRALLEFPLVAPRLTRLEAPWLARLEAPWLARSLAPAFTRLPWLARFERPAALAAIPAFARRLKRAAFFRTRREFAGSARGSVCFPTQCGATWSLWRQNVEFRFCRALRCGCFTAD
jgi:hypothetical protein